MKTMSPKVLVSGIVLVALVSLTSLAARTPADEKWEYAYFVEASHCRETSQARTCGDSLRRKLGFTVGGPLHHPKLFDPLGAQGWELVMEGPGAEGQIFWFKRRR